MNQKDFLILTKGRVVCLMLNMAQNLLSDFTFDNEVYEVTRKECEADLSAIIIQVATIASGCDNWLDVSTFLVETGISLSEDLEFKMMYMESISEVKPSDERHN